MGGPATASPSAGPDLSRFPVVHVALLAFLHPGWDSSFGNEVLRIGNTPGLGMSSEVASGSSSLVYSVWVSWARSVAGYGSVVVVTPLSGLVEQEVSLVAPLF